MKILKKYCSIFIVICCLKFVNAANLLIAVPYSTTLEQQLFKTTKESPKANVDSVPAESSLNLKHLLDTNTNSNTKENYKPQEFQAEFIRSLFQSASAPSPAIYPVNQITSARNPSTYQVNQIASGPSPATYQVNRIASAPSPSTYPVNRQDYGYETSVHEPNRKSFTENDPSKGVTITIKFNQPPIGQEEKDYVDNGQYNAPRRPIDSLPYREEDLPKALNYFNSDYASAANRPFETATHPTTPKFNLPDIAPTYSNSQTVPVTAEPVLTQRPIGLSPYLQANVFPSTTSQTPTLLIAGKDPQTLNNNILSTLGYHQANTFTSPISPAQALLIAGKDSQTLNNNILSTMAYNQANTFPSPISPAQTLLIAGKDSQTLNNNILSTLGYNQANTFTSPTSLAQTLLLAGKDPQTLNNNFLSTLGYHQAQQSQQMENVIYDFDDTIFNNGFLKGIRNVISNGIKMIREKPIIPQAIPRANPVVDGKELFSIAPVHPEKAPTKPVEQLSSSSDINGNGYGITTDGTEEVDKGLGFLSFSKAANTVLDTVTSIPSNIDLMLNDFGRAYRQQLFNLKEKVTEIKNSRTKSKATSSAWLDDFGAK